MHKTIKNQRNHKKRYFSGKNSFLSENIIPICNVIVNKIDKNNELLKIVLYFKNNLY